VAPGVDIEPLSTHEFVCALPPGHALTRKRVIRPKDLEGVPFLTTSQASHQHQRIHNVLAAAGVTPDIVFEASNSAPICALVARNMGVAILDPITAMAHQRDGVVLRRFAPSIPYALKIVYPASRPRSDRVRAFVDLVRDTLSAFPSPSRPD
jgi:DNA-binding transcriptional LysR family regulator